MAQKQPNREIPLQEINRTLDQSVAGADPLRADRLGNLTSVRQAKSSGQQRDLKRLEAKYGSDHPRVQGLKQKMTANQTLVQTLKVETERAEVDFPMAAENTWILHGYVFRRLPQRRSPLAEVTLVIADQKGNPVEEAGYACTNDQGYFRLEYSRKKATGTAQPVGDVTEVGVITRNDTASPEVAGISDRFRRTATVAKQPSTYFAQVLDKQGALLHRDDQAIEPGPGQVDYIEIVVGEPPCPSPFEGQDEQPDDQPDQDLGDWVVSGRVLRIVNDNERPLGGVMVSAFDADERFDDKLGAALTLKDGSFEIRYRQHDFARDSEKGTPDLYVTVIDQSGKQIYSSRNNIRQNAKREEVFQITIS
ncbi:hypothetical protein [Halomicronema sp. CCY15110]|uniref:hypothetical protein n=1 Tax=Halomicronema sp. CCY15110 TaxID=2767773 RepID=UPI0019506196|nr:hypothetical protein [Halomicronema sp. CCY15110]